MFGKIRSFLNSIVTPKSPPLSPYRAKIQALWQTTQVNLSHANEIFQAVNHIVTNQARYEKVGMQVGIPWYVIGVIHMREAMPAFSFQTHLANGDPLFNAHGTPIPTTHVPKGFGPFEDWEHGAVSTIVRLGFNKNYHWDLVNTLENLEIWNGLGYKASGLDSPYIWSMTNHYQSGKFTSDHHYDKTAIDEQPGCAAVLLALKSQGIDLNEVYL